MNMKEEPNDKRGGRKLKKKPILSISLLSCGVEPHIEDCLKGLVPLKENLGAELIIVDTSPEKSGDVRSIIEQYADEVIDFDWCDDFAAARNAGLSKCSGEWFFYVDDDEVLENTKEIVRFFLSGEYQNYNTASIIIRNLGDEKGTTVFDSWVPRIHKRPDGAHFESRIHEHYIPGEYPIKALNVIARHYGYIFRTKEEFLAHSKRNLSLIEKELAENPDDDHMRIHFFQEYVRQRDFDRQREIAEDFLIRLKGKHDRQSAIYRGICHGMLLRADRIQENLAEGKKRIRSLEKEKQSLPVVKAFYAMEAARIFDKLSANPPASEKDPERYTKNCLVKSKNKAKEYLSIYDAIRNHLNEYSDEMAFYLGSTFDEENMADMKGILKDIHPPDRQGIQTLMTEDDEEFILSLSFDEWKEKIDAFMDISTPKGIADRYSEIASRQENEDIRYDYFYSRVDEKLLMSFVRQYDGVLPEDDEGLGEACRLFLMRLAGFCEKVPAFYEKYRYSLDEKELESAGPKILCAQTVTPIVLVSSADPAQVLGLIRKVLGTYLEFDAVLTYFAHLYGETIKRGLSTGSSPFDCSISLWKRAEKTGDTFPRFLDAVPMDAWSAQVSDFVRNAAETDVIRMLGIFDSYPKDCMAANYARRMMRQRMIEDWMKAHKEGRQLVECRTTYGRDTLIMCLADDFSSFMEAQMWKFESDIRTAQGM